MQNKSNRCYLAFDTKTKRYTHMTAAELQKKDSSPYGWKKTKQTRNNRKW